MNKISHSQSIPETAFCSPISVLTVPSYVHDLLTENQILTVGELIQWLETDRKQVLAIRDIGPKILEQLEAAIQNFTPTPYAVNVPQYPPPVPTLADYYKPLGGKVSANAKNEPEPVTSSHEPEYPPPVPSLADYFIPTRNAPKTEPLPEKTESPPHKSDAKQKKAAKDSSKKKNKKGKSRKGKKK